MSRAALTLAEALGHPAGRRVVVAVLSPRQTLTWWTATGGGTPHLWQADTPHRVTGCLAAGVALTEAASLAAAEAAAGSYFWDSSAGRVYVRLAADADPRGQVVQAVLRFAVATHPKLFAGEPFEPRLFGVPDVSLRIPERFGGRPEYGGGTVELANEDGWFDALAGLEWDAGRVDLYVGVDL